MSDRLPRDSRCRSSTPQTLRSFRGPSLTSVPRAVRPTAHGGPSRPPPSYASRSSSRSLPPHYPHSSASPRSVASHHGDVSSPTPPMSHIYPRVSASPLLIPQFHSATRSGVPHGPPKLERPDTPPSHARPFFSSSPQFPTHLAPNQRLNTPQGNYRTNSSNRIDLTEVDTEQPTTSSGSQFMGSHTPPGPQTRSHVGVHPYPRSHHLSRSHSIASSSSTSTSTGYRYAQATSSIAAAATEQSGPVTSTKDQHPLLHPSGSHGSGRGGGGGDPVSSPSLSRCHASGTPSPRHTPPHEGPSSSIGSVNGSFAQER